MCYGSSFGRHDIGWWQGISHRRVRWRHHSGTAHQRYEFRRRVHLRSVLGTRVGVPAYRLD